MMDYQKIKVRKASREIEAFSEEKVRSSLQRAGVEEKLINEILIHVKKRLYEGISTKEIYSYVFQFLKETRSDLASKYSLRQGIMQLGPSGYPFEKFVAGILASEGYQVKTNQIINGKCISHEVDVVAQKDNFHFMIECKFHSRLGTKTEIKNALCTYARFLDLQNAWQNGVDHSQKFYQAWLVTNTKVTSEVKIYGQCVGMRVISWGYPDDFSLRLLVEKHQLHPVTCLHSLSKSEKKKLLKKGIVFCHDLLRKGLSFLPGDRAAKLEEELHLLTRE